MLARLLLALIFLCGCPAIAPAKSSAPPDIFQQPMTVTLVSDANSGCEPDCPRWIAMQGKIGPESPGRLRKVLNSVKGQHVPVLVHSPGGSVEAGFAMGRMIRAAGLDVAVAKTLTVSPCPSEGPCAKALRDLPARGHALDYRAYCFSSCVFVLAGGVERYVDDHAYAGVHQVTVTRTQPTIHRVYRVVRQRIGRKIVEVSRTLIKETTTRKTWKLKKAPKSVNDTIEAYFKEMGMRPSLVALLLATPADSMHYLNWIELRGTELATKTIGAAALLNAFVKAELAAKPYGLNPAELALMRIKPGKLVPEAPVPWIMPATLLARPATRPQALTPEELALMGTNPGKNAALLKPAEPIIPVKPAPPRSRLASGPTRHFDAEIDMGTYDGQPVTASLSFVGQFAMPGQIWPVELQVKLNSNGKAVAPRLMAFSIALGPGRAILATFSDASAPDGPMIVQLMPDDFCRLSASATAKLRLGTPESDLTIVKSLVEVPAVTGLPLNAMAANFCP